jgi:CRISPR-associated protein Csm2
MSMCAMQKPEDFYPKSKQTPGGGPHRPSYGGGGSGGRPTPPGGGGSGPDWPPKYEHKPNYFFENGHLKESLLTYFAEDQALAFVRERLNSSQLRKFYHEVKALEAKIAAGGFEANAPFVKMMRSKVAYACPARGEKKIPESFAQFLWQHIEQVRSERDFKAFCTVFEAVVGFFYGKGGR